MRRAFTLIELLVAISVLVILTAMATVSYNGVQARSRDSQRKNDLSQLKVTLSTYYSNQGPPQYVNAASKVTLNNSTDILSATLKPSYIKNIPLDPRNTDIYLYRYQSFGIPPLNFKLYATLENQGDSKGWGGGSSWVADGYIIQNDN